MVKIIFVLCLAVLVFVPNSFSQSNNNGVLLYSQTNTYQGMPSIPSYKNLSNLWEQVADDFSATSNWSIEQIIVIGDDIDTSSVDGFDINIYTDNGGTPGTLVFSAETQPYSILFLYYFYWKVTITLVTPAELTAGNYFVSVQFRSNSGYSTGWDWTQVTGSFGGIGMFRDYQPYCAVWAPLYHCVPTNYTDMYFELWGNTTVPAELTSFSATVNDDNVELNWITSTETNNQGFEVQRTRDGEFETIGFVEGHGTTTESQAYSFQDKNVVAGKYNYRLKQIDFDGTFEYSNVVEVEITSPSTFSLEQNYPNPFNPSTVISYQLPVSGDVILKVYDVLGNEAATLVNEEKPAGSYSVQFNATNLAGGVYFYQLKAGSFVETKKMLMLK
jgi:hypothetical protein